MQIKNRQQLLLILAVVAVGLFAGEKVIFDPLAKAWSERASRLAQLRKQVAEGNLLIKREVGLRRSWSEMLDKTLTNDTSAAEQQVFNAITTRAQDTGVAIASITPQWKHDSDEYTTYECRVDVAGDISRLSQFLYQVETAPLAFKLESVELSARDKEGQQLTLGLQLSGLLLNQATR